MSFISEFWTFFRAMMPLPFLNPSTLGWISNLLVIGIGLYAWHNFKKIYQETKSRQLLNSVPGIFTSLGIFFTFVSICISLGGISDVSTVSNNVGKTVEDAQNNDIDIVQIIGNLIPAFTTSIWGIIFALWTNFKSRRMFAYEDKDYDEKHHTPEENIESIKQAADSIFGSNKNTENKLEGILAHMKAQDELTKGYNEQLNSNISQQSAILEKFINDFVNRMDDIFTKMHDAVEKQIMAFGQTQFQKTSEVMQKLVEELQAMSKSILDKQNASVTEMMSNTNGQLSELTNNLVELTKNVGQKNSEALDELSKKQTEKLDVIIDSYTQLSQSSVSQFKEVGDEVRKLGAALAEQNNQSLSELSNKQDEKLNAIINGYTQLNQSSLESYKQMADSIKDVSGKTTEEIASKLQETTSAITAALSQQCITLGEAINKNITELDKSYKFINTYIAQIKGDYEQATLAYTDAVQNAHDLNKSFESTIKEVDTGLSSVVSTNEKIDKILKVINDRQTNIEAVIQKIKDLGATIETLQKLESTLNKLAVK